MGRVPIASMQCTALVSIFAMFPLAPIYLSPLLFPREEGSSTDFFVRPWVRRRSSCILPRMYVEALEQFCGVFTVHSLNSAKQRLSRSLK